MTEKNEFDLLADIAKLIKKYDIETFDRLANQISKPEFVSQLVEILAATVKVARSVPSSKKRKNKVKDTDFRSSIIKLAETEPHKSELLLKFYDGLLSKTILPSFREIKTFAQDNGLPELKSSSREKAIVPLIKLFIPLQVEQIENYLSKIHTVTNIDDRSLEGWSNIILNPRKNPE